jgi:hypothetical protein
MACWRFGGPLLPLQDCYLVLELFDLLVQTLDVVVKQKRTLS